MKKLLGFIVLVSLVGLDYYLGTLFTTLSTTAQHDKSSGGFWFMTIVSMISIPCILLCAFVLFSFFCDMCEDIGEYLFSKFKLNKNIKNYTTKKSPKEL